MDQGEPMRMLLSILLVLVFVPAWSGDARLPLLGTDTQITVTRVALDPARPAARRVGALTWLGGIELSSRDPAFGGFSALHVAGDRFTLLSDGGNIVRFTMNDTWRLHDIRFSELPGGPGTGWTKKDRDSESMSVDPVSGDVWVGFENANEFWRYDAGFTHAQAHVAPPTMRNWPENRGPEAMTLLPGGRMVTIAEQNGWPRIKGRGGIVFYGDPVLRPRAGFRFTYRPPPGYDPSDMAVLPDGRWLILGRRFRDFTFSSTLTIVDPRQVRPGAIVSGRTIATLAAPLIHENLEGIAITRERGATIVWLVSDDNQLIVQRSLLLKFRLEPDALARP